MIPRLRILIRNFRRSVVIALVMITDLTAIIGSFALAASLSHGTATIEGFRPAESSWLLVSLIVLLGLQTSLGSYRSFRQVSPLKQHRIALRSYWYGIVMTSGIILVVQDGLHWTETVLSFFLLLPFLYLLLRSLLWFTITRMRPAGLGASRTVVIGEGPVLDRVLSWLKKLPGYELVGLITPPKQSSNEPTAFEDLGLEERIVNDKVDLVLLSCSSMNGSQEYLERLSKSYGIHVRVIPPEIDLLFTRTLIDDLMGIPLVLKANHGFPRGRMILKRTVDLAGAFLLSVVLSPILLLVAVATKLESPGPVLFKQRRSLSGSDRAFDIYKFRSMQEEAHREKTGLKNESSGALFKVKNDPRVTRVGRFIRRYSIDELPQLINIFKGEMSLVGPRPLPVEDFNQLSEDDTIHRLSRHRSAMKPGLTGLWQISGRSDLGFREMVLLDVYYIEHHTHLFDLEILLRTVPAVLFAKGAY